MVRSKSKNGKNLIGARGMARRILDFENPAVSAYDNYVPQFLFDSIPVKGLKRPHSLSASKKALWPIWRAFFNMNQGLDNMILQDAYISTISGRCVDFLSWLAVAKGSKPVLELRDPSGNKQEDLKQIESDQKIIQEMIKIDNSVGDPDDETEEYEHTLIEKQRGMFTNALVYGKATNIRIVEGNKYNLVPLHSRDIVYNIVNEKWKLEALHTTLSNEPYTMNNLIYAEYNPENPVYNTLYNGFPFSVRALDSSRTLRRLKGKDFQLIAKKHWTGSSLIAMTRRDGKSDAEALMKKLNAGEIYASEETDPEKAYKIHDIPLKTDSRDLIEMAKYCTNDVISTYGIPTSLFFDESAANMATLLGKLRFFQKVIENEWRSWFAPIWGKQWYQRNFKTHYANDDKEFLSRYRIKCEFEDIDFESDEDKMKAILLLNKIAPLNIEAIGERLGDDNFASKIDPEKQAVQDESFSVTDETGKVSTIDKV